MSSNVVGVGQLGKALSALFVVNGSASRYIIYDVLCIICHMSQIMRHMPCITYHAL